MQKLSVIATAIALVFPIVGTAQPCPPPPPRPNTPIWFDFQTDSPAKFVGETTRLPFPDPTIRGGTSSPGFALAQFVVDTTGKPRAETLRMLLLPPELPLDSVRAVIAQWKFAPAKLGRCLVPQIVQTPLRWKSGS